MLVKIAADFGRRRQNRPSPARIHNTFRTSHEDSLGNYLSFPPIFQGVPDPCKPLFATYTMAGRSNRSSDISTNGLSEAEAKTVPLKLDKGQKCPSRRCAGFA